MSDKQDMSDWEKSMNAHLKRSISDAERGAAVQEKLSADSEIDRRRLKRNIRRAMLAERKKEISN